MKPLSAKSRPLAAVLYQLRCFRSSSTVTVATKQTDFKPQLKTVPRQCSGAARSCHAEYLAGRISIPCSSPRDVAPAPKFVKLEHLLPAGEIPKPPVTFIKQEGCFAVTSDLHASPPPFPDSALASGAFSALDVSVDLRYHVTPGCSFETRRIAIQNGLQPQDMLPAEQVFTVGNPELHSALDCDSYSRKRALSIL